MSNKIDWSTAPLWANAVIRSELGAKFYVSQFGGKSVRQRVDSSFMDDNTIADMEYPHEWKLVENRPVEGWNGEDLPPIGTVCEHEGSQGWSNPFTVEVVARKKFEGHGEDKLVVFITNDDVSFSSACCFRPARTTEQIAAEVREKAIEELWKDAGKPDMPLRSREQAAKLYDAGWRKVDSPK